MKNRLPAYAKPLLEARRVGKHPACVVLIFGDDWTFPGVWSRIAVKPNEWAPGRFDWTVCAGVPVHVSDRSTPQQDNYDDAGDRKLFYLLGELARVSGPLTFEVPEPLWKDQPTGPTRAYASEFALLSRSWSRRLRCFMWPNWWSESVNTAHHNNFKNWQAEAQSRIEYGIQRERAA